MAIFAAPEDESVRAPSYLLGPVPSPLALACPFNQTGGRGGERAPRAHFQNIF
jgi:hypothetical protein